MWPPHLLQYWRWLSGVFWNVATYSAPLVTRTASGLRLVCGYAANAFYLEDSRGNKITVPYSIVAGDRVLIGIVQTATQRKLYVGKLTGTPASAVGSFAPLGALSTFGMQE